MVQVAFVKLNENAKTPRRGSLDSAGVDIASTATIQIPAHGKALVPTGVAMALPKGHYGRVAPRSGFSWKNHADIGAGVIDADYRGEIKVLVFNHKPDTLVIRKGDWVAQLILEKISQPQLVEMATLNPTARGDNGFGSTGAR